MGGLQIGAANVETKNARNRHPANLEDHPATANRYDSEIMAHGSAHAAAKKMMELIERQEKDRSEVARQSGLMTERARWAA